jgi:hypothetical protein
MADLKSMTKQQKNDEYFTLMGQPLLTKSGKPRHSTPHKKVAELEADILRLRAKKAEADAVGVPVAELLEAELLAPADVEVPPAVVAEMARAAAAPPPPKPAKKAKKAAPVGADGKPKTWIQRLAAVGGLSRVLREGDICSIAVTKCLDNKSRVVKGEVIKCVGPVAAAIEADGKPRPLAISIDGWKVVGEDTTHGIDETVMPLKAQTVHHPNRFAERVLNYANCVGWKCLQTNQGCGFGMDIYRQTDDDEGWEGTLKQLIELAEDGEFPQ